MTRTILLTAAMLTYLAWPAQAADVARDFDRAVRPFLAKHCVTCHGPEVQESDLRLDQLSGEIAADAPRRTWSKVVKQLRAGKMPPKEEPRPAAEEMARVAGWIETALAQDAAARRGAEGRVVLRRLNRVQYENTIHDLLAIDTNLKDDLPEDGTAQGFDTVGEALNVSSVLLERYLEAADRALDAAIVKAPRPETQTRRFRLQDQKGIRENGRIYRVLEDAVVLFNPGPTVFQDLVRNFVEDGRYRVRLSTCAYQSKGPMTLAVYGGDITGQRGQAHLVGYFDVPPDSPHVIEFEERMEPRDSFKIVPYGLTNAIYRAEGAASYDRPGLAVQWLDVEGPLVDQWPPESHRRLFGDLPLEPVAAASGAAERRRMPQGTRAPMLEVVSDDPYGDAESLLRGFATRAFRRPVTEDELRPFVALVRQRFDSGYRFEEAMRVGFKAVLCAPEFLFFHETPGRLDDYALAARLSYFLLNGPADEALLAHAAAGDLGRPEVLRSETERLLDDPRAHRFTSDFVGQWLNLREIEATTPDPKLYPEFDELLQVSMVRETELFFEELLKHDLSVRNVIDSDFTMLNERLARHYGIEGVTGQEFRRVALPTGSGRGGILTQASVLKVTANGTNTSPVIRGVWLLRNILGDPPQPPPPNVPAVEPDIRGATTIRAQLAQHRTIASCARCHAQIDPPGFALEGYDVIGGQRDFYRAIGDRLPRVVRRIREGNVQYRRGPDVDAGDVLPDGRRFHDFEEFRQILLADKDRVVLCVAEKLLVYATGAAIDPADRQAVALIVQHVAARGDGLRSLVHEVVQSDLFRAK
jgi:mono/diheme cytochrome c family protein